MPGVAETVALLAVALLGAAFALRGPAPPSRRWVVALALATVGLVGWGSTGARRAAEARRRTEEQALPARGVVGFASSDACRSCHPAEYDSWHRSYHRTMTQPPSPATVRPAFDGRERMAGPLRVRPERRDDAWWLTIDGVAHEVVMVTGSHSQQRFWTRSGAGRALSMLRAGYLIAEDRWVPGDDTFVMPPDAPEIDEPGLWNRNCINCHSVAGQPRLAGAGIADSAVAELGIACEACHGPGAQHVAAHREPVARLLRHGEDAPDPTIVNPARLSAAQSSQVCGQCHSVFVFRNPAGWRAHGASYRAGDALDADRWEVRQPGGPGAPTPPPGFLESRFWPDGMVRVSGREYTALRESACARRGELSCVSCHTMHRSDPDDQLKAGMDGDAACSPCHDAVRDAGTAHTHHAAESEGSRCQNCHMPYSTFGLLKSIRSHLIDRPSVARAVATGRPDACSLCHVDRPLAWTADWLGRWYGAPAVDLPAEDREVAAVLQWLVRGDAGQRALAAAALAWPAARRAAGTWWMPPYLADALLDPYAAVRYRAVRALVTLDGYADLAVDYTADAPAREAARRAARARWEHEGHPGTSPTGPALLVGPDGALQADRIAALRARRDDRPVTLSE